MGADAQEWRHRRKSEEFNVVHPRSESGWSLLCSSSTKQHQRRAKDTVFGINETSCFPSFTRKKFCFNLFYILKKQIWWSSASFSNCLISSLAYFKFNIQYFQKVSSMIIILLIYSPLMFAITKGKLMKRRNIDNNAFLLKTYLSKRVFREQAINYCTHLKCYKNKNQQAVDGDLCHTDCTAERNSSSHWGHSHLDKIISSYYYFSLLDTAMLS